MVVAPKGVQDSLVSFHVGGGGGSLPGPSVGLPIQHGSREGNAGGGRQGPSLKVNHR